MKNDPPSIDKPTLREARILAELDPNGRVALSADDPLRKAAKRIDELQTEMAVTEQLLATRQQLLEAIPECSEHGSCVSHALEWIKKAKAAQAENARLLQLVEKFRMYVHELWCRMDVELRAARKIKDKG